MAKISQFMVYYVYLAMRVCETCTIYYTSNVARGVMWFFFFVCLAVFKLKAGVQIH